MNKPDLIMSEWNFGLWAMFTSYDKTQAKESYDKGYRYCEIRRADADVTYLKHKPKQFARNTRVHAIKPNGSLGHFE